MMTRPQRTLVSTAESTQNLSWHMASHVKCLQHTPLAHVVNGNYEHSILASMSMTQAAVEHIRVMIT
jgi:hypothetical protein